MKIINNFQEKKVKKETYRKQILFAIMAISFFILIPRSYASVPNQTSTSPQTNNVGGNTMYETYSGFNGSFHTFSLVLASSAISQNVVVIIQVANGSGCTVSSVVKQFDNVVGSGSEPIALVSTSSINSDYYIYTWGVVSSSVDIDLSQGSLMSLQVQQTSLGGSTNNLNGCINATNNGGVNMNGVNDFYFVAGNPTVSSPTIALDYPSNSSSIPTFQGFQFHTQNVTGSILSYAGYRILWSKTSSSLSDTIDWNNLPNRIYSTNYRQNISQPLLNPDCIPNITTNCQLSFLPTGGTFATGTWYAKAYLYQSSTNYLSTALPVVSDLIATSSLIHFDITTGTPNLNLPSNFNGQAIVQPNPNFELDCSQFSMGLFSSTTIDAIGCKFEQIAYNIGQFFFSPHNISSQYFNNTVSQAQQTFPFSVFFGVINNVSSSLAYASNTPSLVWTFNASASQGTTSFALLSSSTLSSWLGVTEKNAFFEFQKYFFYALTLLAIVFTVYHKSFTQKT